MTRAMTRAIALTLIATWHTAGASENLDAGKAVVEKLHATLLQVMTNAQTLGFGGRVATLDPVLSETFDFSTISRIVTGRHWKSLAEKQRNGFVTVFARLSAATYASNFDGFSGESFETLTVEERRGRILVKTAIVKADGERVTLDYLLVDTEGLWRIVNVIADGVSDLSLKRAEYMAVIKNNGFDSLVGKLNDKIADYGETVE